MKRFFSTHATTIFLLMLCCVGFVLRWPAVWFGLPYTPHPDEPYVINMVLKMLAQGSLFPGSFDRPHLSVYPVWLAVWLQALRDPIPAELLLRTTDRITQVVMPFVVGRMTSIVMALVAIPLVAYHVRQKTSAAGPGSPPPGSACCRSTSPRAPTLAQTASSRCSRSPR